jgi:SAM-dependent methyltransferase
MGKRGGVYFSPPRARFLLLLPLLCAVAADHDLDQSPDVAAQYMSHPYPPVDLDPAGVVMRAAAPVVLQSPSHLAEMNHWLFRGRADFCSPSLRILVAGGGTGEKTAQLVRQLEDIGSRGYQVVHLDLSPSSVTIARNRIALSWPDAVQTGRVIFHSGSLLDVAAMLEDAAARPLGVGKFDYIDCLGVLHHLKQPSAGLRALQSVLKDGGGLAFMVYGELGRIGIYHMQRMMRLFMEAEQQEQHQGQKDRVWPGRKFINMSRRLLANLPSTNWLKMDRWRWKKLLRSVNGTGESGIVDMFLPGHDVPMRVPEVYAMADAADMEIVSFVHPALYRLETYVHDPALLKDMQSIRSRRKREEFAELLSGNHFHHFVYARKLFKGGGGGGGEEEEEAIRSSAASIDDPNGWDLIPVPVRFRGKDLARVIRTKELGFLPWKTRNLQLFFRLPALAADILEHMNGRRTVAAIFERLTPAVPREQFRAAFLHIQKTMTGMGKLFLSHYPVTYMGPSGEERELMKALYPTSPEWGYYALPHCQHT